MSSVVRVLSLLEAYEERQQEAQHLWKTSQWNITKARQSKRVTDGVTATNVREELWARCVLVEDVPSLVADEDDSTRTKLSDLHVAHFRLVDPVVVDQAQTDKENADNDAITDEASNTGGLRNRKAKNLDQKHWTVTMEDSSKFANEEAKLRSVDPIELFGLPTRELRKAQEEARRAVALYVEAANLVLALQQAMKE